MEATALMLIDQTPAFDDDQVLPPSVDRENPETSPPARTTSPSGSMATTFWNPPPSTPVGPNEYAGVTGGSAAAGAAAGMDPAAIRRMAIAPRVIVERWRAR